jgi:hypothetical protein
MELASLINYPDSAGSESEFITLSSASLESFWMGMAGESYASRQGLQIFLDVVKEIDATRVPAAEFNYSPTGWEVRLSRAVAQVVLSSALLGGLLAMLGADQLPAAVLAAVVPLLFDVERVSMEESDRYLLGKLLNVPGVAGVKMTREQLYARLPKQVRKQTTLRDFIEFLDVCNKVGQADVDDGHVIVHAVGDKKFRVTFR